MEKNSFMGLKSKIRKIMPHFLYNALKFIYNLILFFYFSKKQKNIQKRINVLKRTNRKLKVAFLHMYATDCQNLIVFEKMLGSEEFDPYFIVNPDVFRSIENFNLQYIKSIDMLRNRYGNDRILLGYDLSEKKFNDYSEQFDMMTTNNPYDHMAHQYFKISYWGKKGIPIFYISYFYMGRCHVTAENFSQKSFNYIWKIFVENESAFAISKKYEILKGKNVVVSGYPKFDSYANLKPDTNDKIIIIAPHHSIETTDTSVGTFLEMEKIYLKLPRLYPEIKFVFRPHPLLFEKLNNIWTQDRVNDWKTTLLSNENVIFSEEGDYLQLFMNSSALIHDCGSFTAEYLFTEKPCAYIHRKIVDMDKTFTEFGKQCISYHYPINNEEDILKFINKVVIDNNDCLKDNRKKFAESNVMINYPHSSDFILNYLSENILG